MAWITGLLGVLKALFGFGQAVAVNAGNAQQQKAGQAEQKSVDQGEALAASKRMDVAGASPSGRDVTQKELDDGTL